MAVLFSTWSQSYLRAMNGMKWLTILVASSVIGACFFPWISVPGKQIMVSGFHTDIPDFGKPGIVHVIFCFVYIVLILIQKSWSIRAAFFTSTINIAWAARNYFLISACRAGICPQKHIALYVILFGSILVTLLTLSVSIRKKDQDEKAD